MQRAIRRLGFLEESEIDSIADTMYCDLHWENDAFVLQYITIGRQFNKDLQKNYPQLVQITWDDIARFLLNRFKDFPEKLPSDRRKHAQWPEFGIAYGQWFRPQKTELESLSVVRAYISTGQCA